ncbi:MAG: biotin transporter BioY [Clostridiales bacterium]|nr:biotin transporter BioY [Clostridiales bacterium]
MSKKLSIKKMSLCALFTALIAVGAFIKIPVPLVPFTLQTMFVTLAGLLLGGEIGGLSALLYMVLGLIGIPVFTGGGGFNYVLKPTFGYIIGFCIAAYTIGKMTHKGSGAASLKQMIIAMLVGLGIIYLIGLIYFYIIMNFVSGTGVSVAKVLTVGFLMTIPGDLITCSLACVVSKRIQPHISKYINYPI